MKRLGGKELTAIWRSHTVEVNAKEKSEEVPAVVGDYLAWKIGYAQLDIRKGDSIYVKRSDAEKMYALLRIQFGD